MMPAISHVLPVFPWGIIVIAVLVVLFRTLNARRRK